MISYQLICCVIIASMVTFVKTADDTNITSTNFDIKVVGRSGKIVISDKATKKAVMTINPDRIAEISADGTTEAGHTIESFASTDFTFGSVTTGTRYGLNTTAITFTATLTNKATGVLIIEMLVFHQAGTITAGSGETLEVDIGSVKFNIDITGWLFCGTGSEICKKSNVVQVGTYIDLTMEIKGRNEKTVKPDKASKQRGSMGAETFGFDGIAFTVSKMVEVDSVWTNMTAPYPIVEQKGKKTLFTFRFPKFNTKIHYDPITGDQTGAGLMMNAGSMYILFAAFSLVVLGKYT